MYLKWSSNPKYDKDVEIIQRFLNTARSIVQQRGDSVASWPMLKDDGYFGEQTAKAVDAFQKHEGLTAPEYGVVGDTTYRHLTDFGPSFKAAPMDRSGLLGGNCVLRSAGPVIKANNPIITNQTAPKGKLVIDTIKGGATGLIMAGALSGFNPSVMAKGATIGGQLSANKTHDEYSVQSMEMDYEQLLGSNKNEAIEKETLYGDALALSKYVYIVGNGKPDKGFHSRNYNTESNFWISTDNFLRLRSSIEIISPNVVYFCEHFNNQKKAYINPKSGYSSVCMLHIKNKKVIAVAYVTQGTDPTSIVDWKNNIKQGLTGNSQQYFESEKFAREIDKFMRSFYMGGDVPLYFMGHSLGGGLAYHNAIVTRRMAITFNAASVNPSFRNKYHANEGYLLYSNKLISFYIEGEVLSTAASSGVGLSKNGVRVRITDRRGFKASELVDRHIDFESMSKVFGLKPCIINPISDSKI